MAPTNWSRRIVSPRQWERVGITAVALVSLLTVLPILGLIIYILVRGLPAISWEFLTGFPSNGMREGGILPAIVGTFYLTLGTAITSVPLGVAAGIISPNMPPTTA